MGACVSKFNGVSGSQSNPPESWDLKAEEEKVKGEVAVAADVETQRRSLGYLFKEKNEGEAPAESSSNKAAVELEKKKDEFTPIPIVEDSMKDEKEKSPIADEPQSKPLEDVNLSSQNVEPEECLKKTEGTDIAKVDEEKHGVAEESGKETGRNEEQESDFPAEKGESEVKLADIETENHGEDGLTSALPQTTKPATRAMVTEDQKPELDEVGKEVQPSDPTNALASENKPETSVTMQNNEEQQIQDLHTDKPEKVVETLTLEKTGTKEQAEMILPPLDAEKQKTEESLVDNSNMEASEKVATEHPATEKSVENIEKEKNNDNKNPESSDVTKEQHIAAVGAETSKVEQ